MAILAILTYLNVATLAITASRPVSWLSYKESILANLWQVLPPASQNIYTITYNDIMYNYEAYILW